MSANTWNKTAKSEQLKLTTVRCEASVSHQLFISELCAKYDAMLMTYLFSHPALSISTSLSTLRLRFHFSFNYKSKLKCTPTRSDSIRFDSLKN